MERESYCPESSTSSIIDWMLEGQDHRAGDFPSSLQLVRNTIFEPRSLTGLNAKIQRSPVMKFISHDCSTVWE